MKIKVCAVCGRVMNEDEDTVYTINEGTDREYIECEQCHDQEWEVNAITNCEGCGRWFSADILQSEEVAPGHTFCPCPASAKDVVDGLTKEEFMEDVYTRNSPSLSAFAISRVAISYPQIPGRRP